MGTDSMGSSSTTRALSARPSSMAVVLALMVGVLIPIVSAIPAHAAGACDLPGGQRTTWTGGGNPGQWNDPDNWSNDSPGNSALPACIPEGKNNININAGAGADSVESFRPLVLEGGMSLFGANKTVFHDRVKFTSGDINLGDDAAEMIFARGSAFNVQTDEFPTISGSGADDVAVRVRPGATVNITGAAAQGMTVSDGRVVNDGTMNVSDTQFVLSGAALRNLGTVHLEGHGDLVDQFDTSPVNNAQGRIVKLGGGTSTINSEVQNENGALDVRGGTLVVGDEASDVTDFDPATGRLLDGTFKAVRPLDASGVADLQLFGVDVLVNSANVILGGKGRITDELGGNAFEALHTVTGAGDFTVQGGKKMAFPGDAVTGDFDNNGGIVVAGKGSRFLHTAGDPAPFAASSDVSALAADNTFTSSGTTTIRKGGRLTTRGDYVQSSGVFDIRKGGRVVVDGRLSILGGEIRGEGVIEGDMELAGTQRAVLRTHRDYDRLTVVGRVIFKAGSTLHLVARRGFKPDDGARFKVMEFKSHRKSFRKQKLTRLSAYQVRRVTRPRSVTAVTLRR